MSLKNCLVGDEPYFTLEFENNSAFGNKAGKTVIELDENLALAHLLMNDVLVMNSWYWEEEWPEDARNSFAIAVNMNDTFVYGADAVPLEYGELTDLYEHWIKDADWGTTVWAAKKIGLMPLGHIATRIKKAGIWDLDFYELVQNIS